MHVCQPDVSIIRAKDYSIVGNVSEMQPEVVSTFPKCPNTDDGVLLNDNETCLYFVDETETCSIATIGDLITYESFQRLVVETTTGQTSKDCVGQHLGPCFLRSFSKPYRLFVVYLDMNLSRVPGTTYFQQIGNKAGYYLADVVRRRLFRLESYAAGIKLLKDGYMSVDTKHLCEKNIRTAERPDVNVSSPRQTTAERRTSRPVVTESSSVGGHHDRQSDSSSASLVVFVITCSIFMLGVLAVCLRRVGALTCSCVV